MKNLRAAIAASTLAMLAACADSPTGAGLRAPGGIARAGGHGYGSGNIVPNDTSASTTATDPAGTAAESPDSPQERGGLGYGSGN